MAQILQHSMPSKWMHVDRKPSQQVQDNAVQGFGFQGFRQLGANCLDLRLRCMNGCLVGSEDSSTVLYPQLPHARLLKK
eukprot:CAMPEP_0181512780 /NCGR_PEP_ID=MMETSP1110-20121109/62156_1 /TAXON_ID=174948 /ORGANISM="Symbiodinium sp., Strain CCMP421" /LENGTH=78 /DNA_ID=CAMNT_0023642619 /DNA_START=208 /DNA_END=441 /DNA_ORIENTATION=+